MVTFQCFLSIVSLDTSTLSFEFFAFIVVNLTLIDLPGLTKVAVGEHLLVFMYNIIFSSLMG